MFSFRFLVYFTLTVFLTTLGVVTLAAYSRPSGNTGLDMSKIHLLRAP